MAVRDWTRVYPGTFHDFHGSWIIHIKEALNENLLPPEYYALSEQHLGAIVPDVLTLSTVGDNRLPNVSDESSAKGGMVAVAEAPPKVELHMIADEEQYYRLARRTLSIRHHTSRRLVAMIEIVSPGNKDRQRHLDDFVDKAIAALQHEVQLLIVDLFPPGNFDPQGVHGETWSDVGGNNFRLPQGKPLKLASYVAQQLPQAYVQPLAVGDELIDMPLFLEYDRYVPVPLGTTYAQAYRGVPKVIQDILEGRSPPEEN